MYFGLDPDTNIVSQPEVATRVVDTSIPHAKLFKGDSQRRIKSKAGITRLYQVVSLAAGDGTRQLGQWPCSCAGNMHADIEIEEEVRAICLLSF